MRQPALRLQDMLRAVSTFYTSARRSDWNRHPLQLSMDMTRFPSKILSPTPTLVFKFDVMIFVAESAAFLVRHSRCVELWLQLQYDTSYT